MWENRCKIAVSGVGYSRATRTAEVPLTVHALEAGVLLRPIGNVVYFMPPYVIDEEEIALMARTAIAGIERASRD